MLQDTRDYFIDCVREQLGMLNRYGRLNAYEYEDLGMSERLADQNELNACVASIFSDLRSRVGRVNFVMICRNQVRITMAGLSDNQIQKLEMPSQLKDILF